MRILIRVMFLLLMFISLKTSGGSSPPPVNPPVEYKLRILFIKDKSAIIRIPFDRYIDEKISYLNYVLKRSGVNFYAESAGGIVSEKRYKSLDEIREDNYITAEKKKRNAHVVYGFGDFDIAKGACSKANLSMYNSTAYAVGPAAHWYCISSYAFVHAIGHTLGLRHRAIPVDERRERDVDVDPGYNAGYGTWVWVTMMAIPFKDGGLVKMLMYSNPELHCGAYWCGDRENADAARYLNARAPIRFTKIK